MGRSCAAKIAGLARIDWAAARLAEKIAAQTKANLLVDHAALDDPDLIFKREGGGFARLDKMFNGELQLVLESFNESIWQQTAA